MPIIPSNWTGIESVNAIGGTGGGSNPIYQFVKSVSVTITELDTFIDLVGISTEAINRELSLDIVSGRIKLYWKNLDNTYSLINQSELIFSTNFIDTSLGKLGLTIKASEPSELFFAIKWDNDIDFYIYSSDEVLPQPELITVIDNTFYLDETLRANYTDHINCKAYFEDQPVYDGIYYERITIFDLAFEYPLNTGYPTIDNPFEFFFYPQEYPYGEFYRYYYDGESDVYVKLAITSFDSATNTFILGVL